MAAKRVAKKQSNALVRYITETRGEIRKVSWPTREEAWSLSKVVVIVMFVMSVFLGGLDAIFFSFFRWLFAL